MMTLLLYNRFGKEGNVLRILDKNTMYFRIYITNYFLHIYIYIYIYIGIDPPPTFLFSSFASIRHLAHPIPFASYSRLFRIRSSPQLPYLIP